jgi:putative membrane protein
MPHLHHGAMGSSGAVWLALIIAFTALVYLRGWLHLRSTSSNLIAGWRAASFVIGLFSIWVAVASPVAALDMQLLSAHMVQHLLLMTLAAPLIWLGEPLRLLSHGLPQTFVYWVRPLFRRLTVQQLGKGLTQPVFCWLAATAALVGWHLPTVFILGMQSGAWHTIEQASFLATGLLFWWPVVQPWPSVSRPDLSIILYLFLATLPCDILSGFLVFCDRVVYPAYFSSSHPFGFSALEDQQCAGALMWTCVTIVYFVAGAILTMRLLSPQSTHESEPPHQVLQSSAVSQRPPQGVEAI